METLRGIKIFGYGTLIPMDLIPSNNEKSQTNFNENPNDINEILLYGSYLNSQGINTPINHKESLDEFKELPCFSNKYDERSLQQDESFGINSPTRFSSSDQLNSLDKYTTQSTIQSNNNGNNGNNNVLFNNGMFNGNLFDKIVEKAEFGRVVMGVQDI
ncbi:hypothetical protein BN7_4329 [Wickerhamomyces ciferrii]|uniref:Uncharacterized protein n=1 Tax=Wickerhamomyces ciferrii (strain ATCC 14091 / BCRC 22168 / CBS 111 / JCM 3599 / NBRC 0793 / NRRL Y-1031 F-60-10) TaxID=1206466 RepID=K0KPA6_WICCF|nr:uncharacterized protein BN7_4329 [Wickerhamomyces ciferrii]CCH44761.1 hypothetical protein BN7_4329 [Wickerhamomyces ciferrii]